MSQWTNKYSIIRDLSLAQGCLPVALDGTISAGDKPPALNILEETEEEFFHNCTGEGDLVAPDLGLIKQWLDVVRESEVKSDSEDEIERSILIKKLNPLCNEFLPKTNEFGNILPTPSSTPSPISKSNEIGPVKYTKMVKKETKQRNAAMASLLKSIGEDITAINIENKCKNKDTFKLLKPTDFIPKENMVNPMVKVDGWVDMHEKKNLKKGSNESKKLMPILNPTSMFRKKTVTEKVLKPKVEPTNSPSKSLKESQYVPSIQADEYYKKFVQRSNVRQILNEDVWTKAERQMKDIDAKRKAERETNTDLSVQQSPSSQSNEVDNNIKLEGESTLASPSSQLASSNEECLIVKQIFYFL